MSIRTVVLTLTLIVGLTAISLATDAPPAKLKLRGAPAPELGAPASVAQPSTGVPVGANKTYKDPYTGMEFVFVKGGCYQMGKIKYYKPIEALLNLQVGYPIHEVCVNDFWMGKYEVTQGEWGKVMGENPSHFLKCGEDCPVESVSWNDITPFIARIQKNGSKRFRLPTEAEWEKGIMGR
jgi:formylglycine-generating enzyme